MVESLILVMVEYVTLIMLELFTLVIMASITLKLLNARFDNGFLLFWSVMEYSLSRM